MIEPPKELSKKRLLRLIYNSKEEERYMDYSFDELKELRDFNVCLQGLRRALVYSYFPGSDLFPAGICEEFSNAKGLLNERRDTKKRKEKKEQKEKDEEVLIKVETECRKITNTKKDAWKRHGLVYDGEYVFIPGERNRYRINLFRNECLIPSSGYDTQKQKFISRRIDDIRRLARIRCGDEPLLFARGIGKNREGLYLALSSPDPALIKELNKYAVP